tara:strand:- start:21 stop:395 length:375 start_codon:yes stop_codon:yes gene_type:complete
MRIKSDSDYESDNESIKDILKSLAKKCDEYEEKFKKPIWSYVKVEKHDKTKACEYMGFLRFLMGMQLKLARKDAQLLCSKFEMKCGHKHKHDKDLQTRERKRYVDLDKLYDALESRADRRASVA